LVLDIAHERAELHERRQVVGPRGAGDRCRVLRWQAVGLARRIVLDDSSRHKRSEPLTYVALVKTCPIGDLLAGGWGHHRHLVEEPRAVADTCHEAEYRATQDPYHLAGKRFRFCRVDCLCRHFRPTSLSCASVRFLTTP